MRNSWLLTGLLLISCAMACAQKTDSLLNTLLTRYPAEKVYMHFDKDAYVAGETIWFKAYFNNDGLPSAISSNFFIQFTDENGKLVAAKKFPVMGATSNGTIDLPDSLPPGNYFIKAVTPAMLNAGEANVYTRNLYVFNPRMKKTATTNNSPIQVQFFPESGHLVDGILTVVAFKATDAWGQPVAVNGVIRTEEGTTICSFKSYHDGMGKTQFKPQLGKKYKAEVEYTDKSLTFRLPEVQGAGINIKVQDEPGGKLFILTRGERDKAAYSSVSLIATMNNHIVYETSIDFEDYPSVKGHLITDSLPSGILHFTLLNSEGIPIAERLAFVNNGEYLAKADLMTEKVDHGKKAANSFEINFPDAVQRSLSVSVTDGSFITNPSRENIWSAFLLSGDLKGAIHHPSWYFEKKNDSVKQALDNLMLTHGWSRYTWTNLLGGKLPSRSIGTTRYLQVSGTVKDENDKGIINGGKLNIYLEAADSTSQQHDVSVGADGRFIIDSLVFFGNAKFFYVYTNSQGKERPVKVYLDDVGTEKPVYSVLDETKGRLLLVTDAAKEKIANESYEWLKDENSRVKILEKVVVESKSSKKPLDVVNEKYATGVFRAMGKVNLDVINHPANDRSGNVLDYIKNRIQTVELVGGSFVSRKNFSLNTGKHWAVDVFLDESPVNASLLRTLRMDEIAMIKYYEAGFVGVGSSSPGGAIAVYTTKQDKPDIPVEKMSHFTSNGYSVTKEFFVPDYSKAELLNLPDKRTTLYWNPNIYTDSDSKTVRVEFFNNDTGKKYRVVVEGFDVQGKLIHLERWIE
jgi:hypothetical protein